MDLDVWCCPACGSSLEPGAEALRCPADGLTFSSLHGLPVLLRPEDESLLADAEAHAIAWKRDALAPPPDRIADLPYIGGPWAQKARSLELLLRILGSPDRRRVADMGAGTGWLSYRLSEAGFRCYATDISWDPDVGLGAAFRFEGTGHSFERALATLDRWPFRDGSMDVAICNASLHYLRDERPAIAEAARVLRRGGTFVVMNDPVHKDPGSASRASHDFQDRIAKEGGHGRLIEAHRHFVASELAASLRERFPDVRRHDPPYGAGFRLVRWAKSIVLRMELASFPMYVARAT